MIIKLKRKTQPFKPNVNGYTYTKHAFETAINDYMKRGGSVYIAPSADRSSELYSKFGIDGFIDTRFFIGSIDHYSDEYIYISIKEETDLIKEYLQNQETRDLEIYMKYIIQNPEKDYEDYNSKIIKHFKIICFDIPCIPHDKFAKYKV